MEGTHACPLAVAIEHSMCGVAVAVHLYRAERLLTKSYQTCTNPHPSLLLHNPNTHVYIHHDTPLHQHDTCVVVTIVQIHWDYATVIHNHYTTKPAHD